ncbi:MAG: serine/threonine-protein kinase [Myxococcota bacterium]
MVEVGSPQRPSLNPPLMTADIQPDRTGQVVAGRYRLDRLLARGGMGAVYQATQLGLQRTVAIKMFSPRFRVSDPELAKRFTLEAAALARLVHPNVVTLYDYGESPDGDLYMTMELLAGRALAHVIEEDGPLTFDRILRIGLQIARALREAHAQGIVHRDLKPGNVMVMHGPDEETPDLVKVLDFGLVRVMEGHPSRQLVPGSQAKDPGALLGSPRYMAPEQICCEPVDARADIYSFGVLLFQMCAGVPPFQGATAHEIVAQHLGSEPPALGVVGYRRGVPHALELIVRRCLEKRPEQRFASMGQLVGELKSARIGIARGVSVVQLPPFLQAAPLELGASSGDISIHSNPPSQAPIFNDHTDEVFVPPVFNPPNLSAISPPGMVEARPLTESTAVKSDVTAIRDLTAPRRNAPMLLGGALLVVAVGLLVALRDTRSNAPVSERAAVSAPIADPNEGEAHLVFDSVPRGAKVEEQGTVLGVTPFILTVPRTEPDFYRVFIFRMAGHHPATVQTTVTTAKVTVKATLDAKSDNADDADELARLRAQARRVTGNRAPPPAKAPAQPLASPESSPALVEVEAKHEPEVAPAVAPPPSVAPEAPALVAKTEPAAAPAPKPAVVEAPPAPAAEPAVVAPVAKETPPPSAPAPKEEPKAEAKAEPKKVPGRVLEKAIVSRSEPKLPASVLLQHPGEQLRMVAIVCVDADGHFDASRSRMVSAVPGAEETVMAALAGWRYRAGGEAICGPVTLQFDVGK